jgi:hypothetical protein
MNKRHSGVEPGLVMVEVEVASSGEERVGRDIDPIVGGRIDSTAPKLHL